MTLLYWPLYPILILANLFVRLLPPRIAHAIAWVLGSASYVALPNRRRVMGANYAPVLGRPPQDARVQRIGRLAFRNFFVYLYEFLSLQHRSVEDIDKRVGLHVRDDFMEARSQGKGMIFVSAHFGNMDYAGVAVSKRIVPMTVVADALQPQALMDRVVRMRADKGMRLVYGSKAPRAILQSLKKNEAVGFLLDVGCSRKGAIPVTFFGRRTMFPAGPALLSLRTGAPIVVGYALMVGDRIEAYSYPPIYAQSTGDKDADARRCSQMMAAHFEDFIRRYPEQWYIFRPMWGPEGAEVSFAPDAPLQEPMTGAA